MPALIFAQSDADWETITRHCSSLRVPALLNPLRQIRLAACPAHTARDDSLGSAAQIRQSLFASAVCAAQRMSNQCQEYRVEWLRVLPGRSLRPRRTSKEVQSLVSCNPVSGLLCLLVPVLSAHSQRIDNQPSNYCDRVASVENRGRCA